MSAQTGRVFCLDTQENPHQWLREIASRYGTELKGVVCVLLLEDGDGDIEAVPCWVGDLKNHETCYALRKLDNAVNEEMFRGVPL